MARKSYRRKSSRRNTKRRTSRQKGGDGYSMDVGRPAIAGRAEHVRYDCGARPAILNGKLQTQMGGRKHRGKRTRKSKRSRRTRRTQRK